MKSLKVALALSFVAGVSVALAAERTISQKGKVFSETAVQLKKGDTLVFLNDDNVVHNVLSTTPGNVFNLGSITPGHSTPVTFDKTGDVQVLCAIHPSMKMSVKVTD
ncbi:MAG TPA: plastocyanin/azurin family copper-binding protein [Xanthobacteraceae bacterium]|nr:plastocyanin/azurin family copper-binding protein [Xanthobacteraceae bacterium]